MDSFDSHETPHDPWTPDDQWYDGVEAEIFPIEDLSPGEAADEPSEVLDGHIASFMGNQERIHIDPGNYTDSYEEFDGIYTPAVRQAVYALAVQSAVDTDGNPIAAEHLLVSGFDRGIDDESLDATDTYKLSVSSSVPQGGFMRDLDAAVHLPVFDGDDSNEANVIERELQGLRDKKLTIARQLEDLQSAHPEERAAHLQALGELNAQMARLQAAKSGAALPVYYAASIDYLLHADPEYNPLAYARFDEEDATPQLAIYDRRSMDAAGIAIDPKDFYQYRIKARGAEIMRHCVAIIELDHEAA